MTDDPTPTVEAFSSYAPALESRDIVTIRPDNGLWIDGRWVDGSGSPFTTFEPASGHPLATVATATGADVDTAVAAARRALDGPWGTMSDADRGRYVFRIARLVQERSRELAVLESIDGGKPIRESRDVDLPLVAAHFFHHAGWADKLGWAIGDGSRRVQRLGVVAQIIPWNFPLLMAAWKLAPALAAGNTVVLKPAETTPLTALALADILAEADLPPGVVNVITGGAETGAALAAHAGVDKVAFTGSTEVGRAIRRATAHTGARLTLELGGKSAHIVFEDAALDQAVEGVVNGIWFNQGHVCCAGSRLLVAEPIADEFLARLTRRMNLLRVGDPLDKNTDIGAVNSAEQLERIRQLVEVGHDEGAELIVGNQALPERGWYCAPTILANVATSHRVANEEIFGPVLTTMTFRTPAEAVAKANATSYGLAAGVWTADGARILWVSDRLRAGVVWANTYNQFDPASPFGGVRHSGFGREGGRHGMSAYVDVSGDAASADAASARSGRAPEPAGTTTGATRRLASPSGRGVQVPKTFKAYVNGAFIRSESGRVMAVACGDDVVARVPVASRKDLRDAVRAARSQASKWSGATPYLRSQILYRVAEMLDARSTEFVELAERQGVDAGEAAEAVATVMDRWVWWAGWADKLTSVLGSVNPVSGPYLNVSTPRPVGVVAALLPADARSAANVMAAALSAGNAVVAVAPPTGALSALTMGEVFATSDLPAGVINVLTGDLTEAATVLARHDDIDAIDLSGLAPDARAQCVEASADPLTRTSAVADDTGPWTAESFLELTTVWHPARI